MNKLYHILLITFYNCIVTFGQVQNLEVLVPKNDKCILKIFTRDEYGDLYGQGSAVLIDSKGIAVTNFHVLDGWSNAVAITISGEKFKIEKIIDYSIQHDLVKFKLENLKAKVFPRVTFFNGKILKGSSVFTISYPKGFDLLGESTVSQGIVSSIRQDEALPGMGVIDSLLQITAQIAHGSSGGGLFNNKGNLIGITQGTFADQIEDLHANLNKAIPVKYIKTLKRNLNFSFNDFLNDCSKTNLFAQGVISLNNEDYFTAYELFNKYQSVNEGNLFDPKVWYLKGLCAFQVGRKTNDTDNLNLALENFIEALKLDSMSVNLRGHMALTFQMLKNMNYAFAIAFEGYELNKENAFINYVIGKLYNASVKEDLAIKYFNNAIYFGELNQMDQSVLARWYLERAIAYEWSKLDDARNDINSEADYKKCLQLDPNNPDALYLFANFLSNRKRYSEACAQFRILKSIAPNYKSPGYSVDEELRGFGCD